MILVLITAIPLFMIYYTLFHVNNEEPVFFPFSIKTSKCSGSCNNIMVHMQNCVFLMLLKI